MFAPGRISALVRLGNARDEANFARAARHRATMDIALGHGSQVCGLRRGRTALALASQGIWGMRLIRRIDLALDSVLDSSAHAVSGEMINRSALQTHSRAANDHNINERPHTTWFGSWPY